MAMLIALWAPVESHTLQSRMCLAVVERVARLLTKRLLRGFSEWVF